MNPVAIPFDIYVAQALHGLVYGMLLFLVASGLNLVLGMMGVLNIAHASFYMLGAYFAYSLTAYLKSFWLSLLISPLLVGGIGLLLERLLIRQTYKSGHDLQLLLTFGLFFIINEITRIIWGSGLLTVETPPILSGSIPFMGRIYPVYRLFIIGFTTLIVVCMIFVLTKTRVGIIIRAAVKDAEMVEALGNNVPTVFLLVFGAGSALAGLAGVIAAPFLSVYLNMGAEALMDCFVVIVVGGFGSLFGALIASLLIGQLQSFGILWIPQLAMVFQFLLMALILILRPTGLFGEKE
jgi:branched-chain amino acid transport system permease protein